MTLFKQAMLEIQDAEWQENVQRNLRVHEGKEDPDLEARKRSVLAVLDEEGISKTGERLDVLDSGKQGTLRELLSWLFKR